MIFAIAIVVALLTATLFFNDFFEDSHDFMDCFSRTSSDEDGVTRFLNDPEGADDNGFAKLKVILYTALVIGSGVLTYVVFHKYFPEL